MKNNNCCDSNELPALLSVNNLQAMGLGRSMVYKLFKMPGLPVVHIGGRVFMLRDKFYAWLENGGDSTLDI